MKQMTIVFICSCLIACAMGIPPRRTRPGQPKPSEQRILVLSMKEQVNIKTDCAAERDGTFLIQIPDMSDTIDYLHFDTNPSNMAFVVDVQEPAGVDLAGCDSANTYDERAYFPYWFPSSYDAQAVFVSQNISCQADKLTMDQHNRFLVDEQFKVLYCGKFQTESECHENSGNWIPTSRMDDVLPTCTPFSQDDHMNSRQDKPIVNLDSDVEDDVVENSSRDGTESNENLMMMNESDDKAGNIEENGLFWSFNINDMHEESQIRIRANMTGEIDGVTQTFVFVRNINLSSAMNTAEPCPM